MFGCFSFQMPNESSIVFMRAPDDQSVEKVIWTLSEGTLASPPVLPPEVHANRAAGRPAHIPAPAKTARRVAPRMMGGAGSVEVESNVLTSRFISRYTIPPGCMRYRPSLY